METLEKDNIELKNCFIQDYLICEYKIDDETYREKSKFPVNKDMFSLEQQISIQYNVNNHKEFNVSYSIF